MGHLPRTTMATFMDPERCSQAANLDQTPTGGRPFQAGCGTGNSTLESRLRWKQDKQRYQAYWYEERHLLWAGQEWRLPNVEEREAMKDLPKDHTEVGR